MFSAATLRRSVPEASDEAIVEAAGASAALIDSMPFPTAAAMGLAATLLSTRARISEGSPLESLAPERREAWMDRWAGATLPPLRQLTGGVRSIALAAYFAREHAP